MGDGPDSVRLGDFNSDGKADLVTANYNFSGNVSVLLGNGNGTFLSATNYPAGGDGTHLAVADIIRRPG